MMMSLKSGSQSGGFDPQRRKSTLTPMFHPTKIEAAKIFVFSVCRGEIDYTKKNF